MPGGPLSVAAPLPPDPYGAAPPPLPFSETVRLSFKQAGVAEDWGRNQVSRVGEGHDAIGGELGRMGYRVEQYNPAYAAVARRRLAAGLSGVHAAEDQALVGREDAFWNALKDARRRNPKLLPDMAGVSDQASLEQWGYSSRKLDVQKYEKQLARGGTAGRIVGSLAYGFTDPLNYMPIGGQAKAWLQGSRAVLSALIRGTATNAALSGLLEAPTMLDAKELGVGHGIGDAALNIALGGFIGGTLEGGVEGGRQLLRSYRGTREVRNLIAAARAAVPEASMTPDEKAAIHVLGRTADIAEKNPFVGLAGESHHVQRTDGAINGALGDDHVRGTSSPTVPRPVKAAPKQLTRSNIIGFTIDDLEGGAAVVNYSQADGGTTKYGVAAAHHPGTDVANLTRQQAVAIAERDYWFAGLDQADSRAAAIAFDAGYIGGPKVGRRILEESGGDWQRALELYREHLNRIADTVPGKAKFKRGWNNRVDKLAKRLGGVEAPELGPSYNAAELAPEGSERTPFPEGEEPTRPGWLGDTDGPVLDPERFPGPENHRIAQEALEAALRGDLPERVVDRQVDIIDAQNLRAASATGDAAGEVDLAEAGQLMRAEVADALENGADVTLHIEGKARRITGTNESGIVDDEGQTWGSLPILSPLPGDHARIEIARSTGGTRPGIPPLEPHSGSWVVVSRETGQPVLETFDAGTAGKVNQEKYEVLTAQQWLGRFNKQVADPAPPAAEAIAANEPTAIAREADDTLPAGADPAEITRWTDPKGDGVDMQTASLEHDLRMAAEAEALPVYSATDAKGRHVGSFATEAEATKAAGKGGTVEHIPDAVELVDVPQMIAESRKLGENAHGDPIYFHPRRGPFTIRPDDKQPRPNFGGMFDPVDRTVAERDEIADMLAEFFEQQAPAPRELLPPGMVSALDHGEVQEFVAGGERIDLRQAEGGGYEFVRGEAVEPVATIAEAEARLKELGAEHYLGLLPSTEEGAQAVTVANDAITAATDDYAVRIKGAEQREYIADYSDATADELAAAILAGGDPEKEVKKLVKSGRIKFVDAGDTKPYDIVPLSPSTVVPPPPRTFKSAEYAGPELPDAVAAARLAEWKAEALRIGAEGAHEDDIIVSLFDASGVFSQPYVDMGFHVRRYDLKHGDDVVQDWVHIVNELHDLVAEGKRIRGVIAQPPCTTFTNSGTRWRAARHDRSWSNAVSRMWGEDAAKMFESPVEYNQTLVAVTEWIIADAKPDSFFVIENPAGRIEQVTGLPRPLLVIEPHHFGSPYTKRTHLWGEFNPVLPTANVHPAEGSRMHKLRGRDEKEEGLRSLTPEPFAYAFALANRPAIAAPESTIVAAPGLPRVEPAAPALGSADVEAPQPVALEPGGQARGRAPQAPGAAGAPFLKSGKPKDLLRAIAELGGVRDDEGHMLGSTPAEWRYARGKGRFKIKEASEGRGLRRLIPGVGPLIRPEGMSIDRLGEWLQESGWWRGAGRPTEAEVLDLLEQAAVTKMHHPEAVQARRDVQAGEHDDENAAYDEIRGVMGEHGLAEEQVPNDVMELAIQWRLEGDDPETAWMQAHEAFERDLLRDAGYMVEDDPDYGDVPGFPYEIDERPAAREAAGQVRIEQPAAGIEGAAAADVAGAEGGHAAPPREGEPGRAADTGAARAGGYGGADAQAGGRAVGTEGLSDTELMRLESSLRTFAGGPERFRIDETGPEYTLQEILDRLDRNKAAVDALRGCLGPEGGGG